MSETKNYGSWVLKPAGRFDVGRTGGAQLQYREGGEPDAVAIQIEDPKGGVFELRFDFQDAMFLLSILRSIQLDTGTPFPSDPRRHN